MTAALQEVAKAANEEEHSKALLGILRRSFWRLKAKGEKWNGREWGGSPKECMHPNCHKPPIRSHVIQAARLEAIAGPAKGVPDARSVATLVWNDTEGTARVNDNVSFANVSTFPGFCSTHDNKLFEEMEAGTAAGSNLELHMQAYRSYCRELRKVEGEVEYYEQSLQDCKDAEAGYLRTIFEAALPPGLMSKYPELARMKLAKGVGIVVFGEELAAKRRLRDALAAMRQDIENFVYNAGPLPFHFVELAVPCQLPLALSGVNPLLPYLEGAAARFVPMMMVIMPPQGGPNRAFLCVPCSGADVLDGFVRQKGIVGGGTPRERCCATLAFVDQFLVTATDHWFLTPSFWHGLPSCARDLVVQQPDIDLAERWKPVVLEAFAAKC